MKASEILELVRAGYSKAEITAMEAEPSPAEPAPQPEPAQQPEPAPAEPAPAEPAPAEPASTAAAASSSQMELLLREILGAVQMGNINKAAMEPPVENGADVVTARLINPNYGKEK